MKRLFFLAAIFLLISSCKVENNQPSIDDLNIRNYISINKLVAVKHETGLYYSMTTVGTGVNPTLTSTVEVIYKGSLLDGTVFDQTASGKTSSFQLSGLIPGWQIGVPLMKKGGKATFFIPSALAYGNKNLGIIPPNSVLIFDIELVDVK